MYLLPAIDLLDGKVVRLSCGDYSKVTVYNDDAVAQAKIIEDAGATWLHVVDLDGARDGAPSNVSVIKKILKETNLHVEVGGGIRTLESARRVLDAGAERVIFGTALVKNPDLAQAAVEEFGDDSVVAGIDAKDGDVKVEGWLYGASVLAPDLAQKMADIGYAHLIYTDISKDGMRTGVSVDAYTELSEAFEHPVIASGGIASLDDLHMLADVSSSIEAVIVGRAIYEGAFSVEEAVEVCNQTMKASTL